MCCPGDRLSFPCPLSLRRRGPRRRWGGQLSVPISFRDLGEGRGHSTADLRPSGRLGLRACERVQWGAGHLSRERAAGRVRHLH